MSLEQLLQKQRENREAAAKKYGPTIKVRVESLVAAYEKWVAKGNNPDTLAAIDGSFQALLTYLGGPRFEPKEVGVEDFELLARTWVQEPEPDLEMGRALMAKLLERPTVAAPVVRRTKKVKPPPDLCLYMACQSGSHDSDPTEVRWYPAIEQWRCEACAEGEPEGEARPTGVPKPLMRYMAEEGHMDLGSGAAVLLRAALLRADARPVVLDALNEMMDLGFLGWSDAEPEYEATPEVMALPPELTGPEFIEQARRHYEPELPDLPPESPPDPADTVDVPDIEGIKLTGEPCIMDPIPDQLDLPVPPAADDAAPKTSRKPTEE